MRKRERWWLAQGVEEPSSESDPCFMTSMVSLEGALLILIFSLFIFFIRLSIQRLISFIRLKLFPYIRLNIQTFSPERAYASFVSYALLSERELATKRASYATLSRGNKRLASRIGYERKLLRAREIIHLNAVVTEGIASLAEEEMPSLTVWNRRWHLAYELGSGELSQVRDVIKHFVRDWSEEGRKERSSIFEPVLDVLRHVGGENRKDTKVLVPGCGLGRLAWEISQLGSRLSAFISSSHSLQALTRLRMTSLLTRFFPFDFSSPRNIPTKSTSTPCVRMPTGSLINVRMRPFFVSCLSQTSSHNIRQHFG